MIREKFIFLTKIPFVSKLVVSTLIYLGITILYTNLTWSGLRAKLPFFNRIFYSKHLSISSYYDNLTKNKDEASSQIGAEGLSVQTQTIKEESITPIMSYSAVLEPLERVEVHSKVSGRIETIYVKEGERIKKGSPLVKLDSLTFELDLAKQKASHDSAKALYQLSKDKYEIARKNLEIKLGEADKRNAVYNKTNEEYLRLMEIVRKKEILFNEGVIALEEYENLKLELHAREVAANNARRDLDMILVGIRDEDITDAGYALPNLKKEKIELLKTLSTRLEHSEMEVAATNLKASEVNLRTTEMLIKEAVLYSPIDGLIARIHRTTGELINAGGGQQPIITVISSQGLYVSFAVNEGDLGKIKQGQIANISVDSLPDKNYKGVLKKINPLVDQKSHTVDAKLELSGKQVDLKPGMFVRADVKIGEIQNVIFIPLSAIASLEEEEGDIYVMKDRKAIKQRVKFGEKREDRIQIKQGLSEGEVVILSPLSRLYDGITVVPKFQ
ncbi:efflux RND transporter periplasmic adaptor subunit [Leptospira ognonensis]|uniref:Efflux RND transporter periplasmic adaptor subunit n=1 Tax=Leptospira ognonensis TaxID=2484945 RepID=A0A4R9K4U7_9LEPT|nr:efflux RND transporter periplasmic adaptor subunit [Leptospira ognonensis]TGL61193.1 efflux RND transporter periplasmic adaptor subunit [Leptospira ognonensis]